MKMLQIVGRCLERVLSSISHKYSWPLNNTGLNCRSPLICRVFFFNKYSRPSYLRVLHQQGPANRGSKLPPMVG